MGGTGCDNMTICLVVLLQVCYHYAIFILAKSFYSPFMMGGGGEGVPSAISYSFTIGDLSYSLSKKDWRFVFNELYLSVYQSLTM